MKKVLSIFLALAMLISLIPAVFAADTETEAGIKVVYDFHSDKLTALAALGQNNNDSLNLKTLTYTESKGFWQYADSSLSNDELTNSSGGLRADSSGAIRVVANLTTPRYWIAFKINVPKQAKYNLKLAVYNNAGNNALGKAININAFIFKADEAVNIEDLLVIGNDYNLNATCTARQKEDILDIGTEPLDAGEYYFVIKPFHTNTSGSPYVFLRSLTLTEGDGTLKVPMISSLTATPNEDGTTTVNAVAELMSDGEAATGVTYSYAVADDDDADKAEIINGNVVKGLADGTATIIATATKDGLSSSKSIEVDVTAPVTEPEEDPIPKEEFDAVKDTETITSYEVGTVSAVAYTVGTNAQNNSIKVEANDNENGTYTLDAPTYEGYNFLYWKKGLTEKKDVITYKPTGFVYAPTAGENNIVIAVYEKIGEETTPKAEFYNANGQFIKSTDGAFPEEKEIPSMAGYGDATGWQCYTDGKTYGLDESVTPSGIMLFVADYKDTLDMVKVNGTDVPYGTEMSFTASSEDGKEFKCWTRTDENGNTEIVSIEETYKFRAYENCTIEEVDTDKTVVLPANTRKIVLDTFKAGSATALMAEFIGFKNDTVVEKGIMLGNNRIAMKSTGTQFTIIPDETGTYKGYAIVKDGTDYTLITDGSYTK